MERLLLICFFLVIYFAVDTKAQGCSDAGACTIGSLKHSDPDRINYMLDDFITLGVSGSKGDLEINYYSAELGYSRVINPRVRITGKFNMLITRGELTNTSGISDLFINTDYSINDYSSLTVGVKIPFKSADEKAGVVDQQGNSLSLPMEYQSTLGTADIIAGASFTINDLYISAAVQYPFVQNSNRYNGWYTLPSTNNFQRKGDVIARLSYHIPLVKDKLDFIPGILPIFHLGNDLFTDSAGTEREITGSSGLTLNITSYFIYYLQGNNSLELGIGFPVKTRESRPEGLARKFALSIQFKTYF